MLCLWRIFLMHLIEISESQFEEYSNSNKNQNFWQSVEMCQYQINKGWKVNYVALQEEEEIKGACALISYPVFGSNRVFEALRGFLIDYEDLELVNTFLKELKVFLHKNHCLYMKTDPYVEWQKRDKDGNVIENTTNDALLKVFADNGFTHLGFRVGNDNNYEPRFQSVLPLEGKTEKELLKEMNSHTRQNIKNTQKVGIQIRELDESEFSILKDFVSMTGDRRHFMNPELQYYLDFHHAFKDKMKVYYSYLDTIAYKEQYEKELENDQKELAHIEQLIQESPSQKNIKKKENCLKVIESAQKRIKEAQDLYDTYGKEIGLGAAMFIVNSREIVYLFSGSDNTFNRYKGAYALQWMMIRYGLEHHISRYNFYGISGIFTEDADGYGVYTFKKGFNADVEELIGNFEYIDRKFIYSIYMGLKHIKSIFVK